ncbi:MAG TPA: Tm-1-like ATP-binding domain-containing protein [Chloroflexota bacterium]|nr:Tm-1-like ATP-binding domain-containing protein [Chloroflexota bacterium]
MTTVVLVGTLDTKGIEYEYLRDRLREQGVDVILVDAGILGTPLARPDIARADVARAAGSSLEALVAAGDRGVGVETMARGAAEVVKRLYAEGRLQGILGLGGSGGTTLVTQAMRQLPVGVPKLMVSTVASGDTRPYVGDVDITMMYSVVDIAGLNRISRRILGNAAAAMAGMAAMTIPEAADRPLIGATMFGVTTPCVTAARERLESLGYEVLVFHATGAGGRSMEALIKGGFISAALDVTTTELADELVGGVLSAGPDRLEAAGALGIPQVVSLGALDMVNFGPVDTVPAIFKERLLYKHNSSITLMRTTPKECAELGRIIARKLNAAHGPLTLFIPLKGVSLIDAVGQPFHDPAADQALFEALRAGLSPTVEVRELDTDLNDPAFAVAMADTLHASYQAWVHRSKEVRA